MSEINHKQSKKLDKFNYDSLLDKSTNFNASGDPPKENKEFKKIKEGKDAEEFINRLVVVKGACYFSQRSIDCERLSICVDGRPYFGSIHLENILLLSEVPGNRCIDMETLQLYKTLYMRVATEDEIQNVYINRHHLKAEYTNPFVENPRFAQIFKKEIINDKNAQKLEIYDTLFGSFLKGEFKPIKHVSDILEYSDKMVVIYGDYHFTHRFDRGVRLSICKVHSNPDKITLFGVKMLSEGAYAASIDDEVLNKYELNVRLATEEEIAKVYNYRTLLKVEYEIHFYRLSYYRHLFSEIERITY